MQRLAEVGAHLLVETVDGIASGIVEPLPQSTDGVSYTSKISTADAHIRWDLPDHLVSRHIRAMSPAPGAWTMLGDSRLKIGGVEALHPAAMQYLSTRDTKLQPGEVLFTGKHVLVGTASETLQLATIQAPGKKMMRAADWARGAHLASDVYKRQEWRIPISVKSGGTTKVCSTTLCTAATTGAASH